jgi:hypothetical protein
MLALHQEELQFLKSILIENSRPNPNLSRLK